MGSATHTNQPTSMPDTIMVSVETDSKNKEAWDLRNSEPQKALELGQAAHDLAVEANYEQGIADSLRTLAYCQNFLGNPTAALLDSVRSKELYERLNDLNGLFEIENIFGQIYWELSDYPQALEHVVRMVEHAQELNDSGREADALNNLSMVYVQLKDFDKAIRQLQKALSLFREANDARGEFFALNNIAMISHLGGHHEEAIKHGLESLAIAEKANLNVIKVKVLDTLGTIYAGIDQLDEASKYLLEALELANEHNLKRDSQSALMNIGEINLQREEFGAALICFQDALQLAQENQATYEISQCHHLLATVHEKLGNHELALQAYKQFHETNQRIFNEQSDRKLQGLEVRHRTKVAQREAELLLNKNEELNIEIAERKRIEEELRRAKIAADAANQAKSKFLSNMSHELRTPLNGILGYAQILKRSHNTLSNSQMQAVDIIHKSGEHLLTLINDVLDFSKIEANQLELHPTEVHLSSFLKLIVDMFQLAADQKGIVLRSIIDPDLPTGILADEQRLRQVLINLTGNALKFTSSGSVTLTVKLVDDPTLPPQDNKLYIAIQDTGVGIAPEDIKKIFMPLVQVGDKQLQKSGTGLGLAISQQLIEAMGGQIAVESQLGKGSRFHFEIVVPSVTITKQIAGGDPSVIVGYTGRRQTIVVVDDKASNRNILIDTLSPLGFNVHAFETGLQAVENVQELKPDLILMDLVMPDLNGFDAARQIRALGLNETTIIALSASILDMTPKKSKISGFDDFLPKPVNIQQLFEKIAHYLNLEWDYEHAAEPIPEPEQEIVLPPIDALQALHSLAMMGDLLAVQKQAKQLGEQDERYSGFVKQILALTREFEEEELITLLETYGVTA